jgi:hypothetical protein
MNSLAEGLRSDPTWPPPLPCHIPTGHVMAGGPGPSSTPGQADLLCKTILLPFSTLFAGKFFLQSRAD